MKISSAAIYLVLTAGAAVPGADAFATQSRNARSPIPLIPSKCQLPSSTSLNYVADPDATDPDKVAEISESIFKDLNDLAALDYDPEDHDSDNQVTEEILDLSLKVVQQLQSGKKSADILKEEALSDEGLHNDDPVSRKKVTTQTNVNKKSNLLAYKIPAALHSKDRIPINDNKLKENASRDLGPLVSLIKELKKNKATSGYAKIGYGQYPPHPEFPEVDLSSMMKMMDGPPPREYLFAPKKIVRILRRVTNNLVGLAMTKDAVENAETAEKVYDAVFTKPKIFNIIPNPLDLVPSPQHTIKHWKDDKELGRQFLNGVNPVMIRVAKGLGEIAEPLAKTLGDERLQRLIDEERLFYVSYDDLADLEVNPHQAHPLPMNKGVEQDQPRYFYPATAVFVLSKGRKELDILGIQLERTANSQVYTKEDSTKSEWMFAKASLATADSQFHEWVSHLGMTHLAMEPHIIAIHNTLRKHKHPIHTFVKPLCKDTLLLNWAARRTLASPGKNSFGDFVTSVGTGQFLQLIQKKWKRYDFFESSGLPSELASRGFTEDFDMPEYLYRKDGMKLWNAYGDFAKDFIDELYATDDEIVEDKVLQEWAHETSHPDLGAVPGFPTSFADKATVVKVLQTLMWMTSGLHAAVNMPQYDFYAYAPNKPLGARAGKFPRSNPETESDWIFSNFMPLPEIQEKILSTVDLLTLPSEHCIDNLSEEFESVGKTSYDKFQAKLDKIGDEIEARNKANKAKGKAVYHYLHPSVVPASIDI